MKSPRSRKVIRPKGCQSQKVKGSSKWNGPQGEHSLELKVMYSQREIKVECFARSKVGQSRMQPIVKVKLESKEGSTESKVRQNWTLYRVEGRSKLNVLQSRRLLRFKGSNEPNNELCVRLRLKHVNSLKTMRLRMDFTILSKKITD